MIYTEDQLRELARQITLRCDVPIAICVIAFVAILGCMIGYMLIYSYRKY